MLIRGTRLMRFLIIGSCICRLFNGVDQGNVQINLIIKQLSNQKNISPYIFHSTENPWSSDKTVLGPLKRRGMQKGGRGALIVTSEKYPPFLEVGSA